MEETELKETELKETELKETELQKISTLVYVNLVDDVKEGNFEIFKMLEYTYRKFNGFLFNTKLEDKQYNHPYVLIIVADRDTFTQVGSQIRSQVDGKSNYEQFFQLKKAIFLDPKADNKYEVEVKGGNLLIESGNISLSKNATDTLKTYSLYDKNYPTINTENDKGITVYWNGLHGKFIKNNQIRKYNVIPRNKPKNGKYFKIEDVEEKKAAATPAGGKTRKYRKRKMRSSKRKASKKGRKSRKKKSSSRKKK